MNSEEEALPTVARWQEITLGNGEDASDIFVQHDEVERFEDKDEFILKKDVEELVQGMLNEFKDNRDDAGALRPCDADIFEERLAKFLNEVQSE